MITYVLFEVSPFSYLTRKLSLLSWRERWSVSKIWSWVYTVSCCNY